MNFEKDNYIDWLKEEYKKAEEEGRKDDLDLIAEQLQSEECPL